MRVRHWEVTVQSLSISGIGSTSSSAILNTTAATSLSYTGATLNGNLTAIGVCPSSVEKGFVYGTASGSYGAPNAVGSTVSTGAYNYALTSLSSGTTYYYKAYVKDANNNYVYGAEQVFTTLSPATQIAFVNVPSKCIC